MTNSKQRYQVIESKPIRDERSRRAILQQVNGLAWLLDNSIQLPLINYRIGLDAIVGLIPGFGDVAGLVVSSVIVLQAIRLGVPRAILSRMLANIILEALVGVVPIVGDLFDATFKANARNVELLNQAMDNSQGARAMGEAAGRGIIAGVIGALVGLLVLVGSIGATLFWWIVSLFR
jgi:hypothetical protein